MLVVDEDGSCESSSLCRGEVSWRGLTCSVALGGRCLSLRAGNYRRNAAGQLSAVQLTSDDEDDVVYKAVVTHSSHAARQLTNEHRLLRMLPAIHCIR